MKHTGFKLRVDKPDRLWPRLVDPAPKQDDKVDEFYQHYRPSIPLDRALLCLDCDSIHEAEGTQTCPACGSSHSWAIGRALNRKTVGCQAQKGTTRQGGTERVAIE